MGDDFSISYNAGKEYYKNGLFRDDFIYQLLQQLGLDINSGNCQIVEHYLIAYQGYLQARFEEKENKSGTI